MEPCYKMIRRELIKLEQKNTMLYTGKHLPPGMKKATQLPEWLFGLGIDRCDQF